MPGLRLDYQQRKAFPWGGLALLALALGVLGATGAYYRDMDSQAEDWEARAAQLERASRQPALEAGSGGRGSESLALEVKRANEVLRQLNLPWERLFRAVELSGGKDVALLALEPDTEKHSVKISGEAKNMATLLDYIKQLKQRDVFGAVYLQNHQILLQDPDKPVRFALLADWLDQP
ncbi:MAG: hypothetical protein K8H84_12350 [Sulfuricella denitrificans]|nr:hypothetical protein [Sulfuricella denitrificans]